MKIYLTAVIKAKTEFRTEVKAVLQNMVEQTHKEEACLQYDLHQGISDLDTFVFYEVWSDQAGLDQHNQQAYIKEFSMIVDTKLQEKPQLFITHKI